MPPTDLDELAAVIEGAVISPGDPGYEQARLVWNSRFDDARPTAVVRPAAAGDVRAAVDFARDHGLPLVARSGGHSFAGYSTGDCLVVDLSAMAEVTVDSSGERATLGAGSTMLPTFTGASTAISATTRTIERKALRAHGRGLLGAG